MGIFGSPLGINDNTIQLNSVRVLLTSANNQVSMLRMCRNIGEELGINVEIFSAGPIPEYSSSCMLSDSAFKIPKAHEADYLPEVLALCEAQGIHMLIPGSKLELLKLASAISKLDDLGTSVVTGSLPLVSLTRDQENLNVIADCVGTQKIRFASLGEVESNPDKWHWPITVVPRKLRDMELGKMILRNPAELIRIPKDAQILLMKPPVGRAIHVQLLTDSLGTMIFCGAYEVLSEPGLDTYVAVTIEDSEILDLAREIALALNSPSGPLTIELIKTKEGEIFIVGLTPMLAASYQLIDRAGGKLLKWMIGSIAGMDMPAEFEWKTGLQMIEYPSAMFIAR